MASGALFGRLRGGKAPGGFTYVQKPFIPDAILKAIEKTMNRCRAEGTQATASDSTASDSAGISDVHSTTREVPYQRLPQERLLLLDEFPDYDTSYMEDRRVAKDCLLSYRGNRYSVPFRFAGKTVLVREPVAGGRIEIYSEIKVIAEHRLAEGRGVMVVDPNRGRVRLCNGTLL